ncbi:MBL fold metallo-hydrolase [Arthrobacter sp. HLT1-20]
MQRLSNGAFQLSKSCGSNGYVVAAGEHLVVIDPGMASGAPGVVKELREAGLLEAVRHVLLTHYDLDHAGAAQAVAAAAGATLWISRLDAQVLRGEAKAGTFLRRLSSAWARPRLPESVSYIGESDGFPTGITAVAAPGHTGGHYAFLWEKTLFCGDAALVRRDGSLKQFFGFINTDRSAALKTAAELEALDVAWVCPGHGKVTQKR